MVTNFKLLDRKVPTKATETNINLKSLCIYGKEYSNTGCLQNLYQALDDPVHYV